MDARRLVETSPARDWRADIGAGKSTQSRKRENLGGQYWFAGRH